MKIYSSREAAEALKVSVKHFYNLRSKKLIEPSYERYLKGSKCYFYTEGDLQRFWDRFKKVQKK